MVELLAEAKESIKTEEQWFSTWQQSEACEAFANEVGSKARKMG